MTALTKEERAALNAMAVKGQLDAARCIERLLMDGDTVLIVQILGGRSKVEIMPPHQNSPLWRDASIRALARFVEGCNAVDQL